MTLVTPMALILRCGCGNMRFMLIMHIFVNMLLLELKMIGKMLKGGGSRDRSRCRLPFRPRVPSGILLTYQRQKGNMAYLPTARKEIWLNSYYQPEMHIFTNTLYNKNYLFIFVQKCFFQHWRKREYCLLTNGSKKGIWLSDTHEK